jgi:prepilin-type N-terminal cleavage/methylation domain-containing protein
MRKSLHPLRKAFTMIEVILVIVILGIVSSIGSEIIANVYEQYIIQRAQHRASIKTELAATQIANRLASAIPGTVVRRTLNAAFTDINEPGNNADDTLQWVGSDMDSFKTMGNSGVAGQATTQRSRRPGWSGFCDVDSPNTTLKNIFTPGSNLPLATTIINNLGGFIENAYIYFPAKSGLVSYPIMGGLPSSPQTIVLNPARDPNDTIVEHYKLAWTSYALYVDGNGNLKLYYNFSPTIGAQVEVISQILLRNVTTFEFRGDGRTIRFKICVEEDIGESFKITSCKEKAVF